jgi:predicted metal-binding membrane protein
MSTPPFDAALEAAIRRDRVVVMAALVALVALSWAYLLAGAGMGMSAFEIDLSPENSTTARVRFPVD